MVSTLQHDINVITLWIQKQYEYFRAVGADPFGFPTLIRPWDDGSNSMANAKRRLRAGFEFFSKLGVPYWTFHDRYHRKDCIIIVRSMS